MFLFEGWRAPDRQHQLYMQGRSQPGNIVTNADAWQSWHQFGLAVDLAFKDAHGQWTWSGDWARVGAILQAQGLEWYGAPGAKFRETPHFQMTCGLTLVQARAIAQLQGVLAVWARCSELLAAPQLSAH